MADDYFWRMAADGWAGAAMRRTMMTWNEKRDHLPPAPVKSAVATTAHVPAAITHDGPAIATIVIILTAEERRTLR